MKLILLLLGLAACNYSGAQIVVQGGPERPSYSRVALAHAVHVKLRRTAMGDLVLPVTINGSGPYWFDIDTGAASGGRIRADLAKKLGLQVVGEVLAGDPSGKNPERRFVYSASSVKVSGLSWSDMKLNQAGRVMPGTDGTLGIGLFKKLLLQLDFADLTVSFSNGALSRGSDVFALHPRRGILVADLTVAGKSFPVTVDTGYSGGIQLRLADAAGLPWENPPKKVGAAKTNFNTIDIYGARLKGDALLGGYRWSNPMVEFNSVFPIGSIGRRGFSGAVLELDQRHRLGRLRRLQR
jgi:hypothetical protein